MPSIVHVVGARPNYVKVAPVWRAIRERIPDITQILVDTGQHYHDAMAGVFRRDLGLPAPDWNLEVGPGPRDEQIVRMMIRFKDVCTRHRPDLVVVVGDVDSTVAAARTASELGIALAHVEAGLRSFDLTMPEEQNRILTDQLADVLLTPSIDGNENLRRQGIAPERMHLVGNVMIDSLMAHQADARFARVAERFPVRERQYAVCTLHRPSNVDDRDTLAHVLDAIARLSAQMAVVFPVHPRTAQRMSEFGLAIRSPQVHLSEPLGYLDFLSLTSHARLVITDSGGLQEESVFLGIPCLTVRASTERPVTLASGANRLVDANVEAILEGIDGALSSPARALRPDFWDGRAAHRIADVLRRVVPALSAGATLHPPLADR